MISHVYPRREFRERRFARFPDSSCPWDRTPTSPDCVFDASLVPGACLYRFVDLKGFIQQVPGESGAEIALADICADGYVIAAIPQFQQRNHPQCRSERFGLFSLIVKLSMLAKRVKTTESANWQQSKLKRCLPAASTMPPAGGPGKRCYRISHERFGICCRVCGGKGLHARARRSFVTPTTLLDLPQRVSTDAGISASSTFGVYWKPESWMLPCFGRKRLRKNTLPREMD